MIRSFRFHTLGVYTGYKLVRRYSLPAETVRHIWLPPRLSRSLAYCRDYRPRVMASCQDCPRNYASCRTRIDSAGSRFTHTTICAGSKRLRTVSAEAIYQSRKETKIGGLV